MICFPVLLISPHPSFTLYPRHRPKPGNPVNHLPALLPFFTMLLIKSYTNVPTYSYMCNWICFWPTWLKFLSSCLTHCPSREAMGLPGLMRWCGGTVPGAAFPFLLVKRKEGWWGSPLQACDRNQLYWKPPPLDGSEWFWDGALTCPLHLAL